jgi:hypothetical protein
MNQILQACSTASGISAQSESSYFIPTVLGAVLRPGKGFASLTRYDGTQTPASIQRNVI